MKIHFAIMFLILLKHSVEGISKKNGYDIDLDNTYVNDWDQRASSESEEIPSIRKVLEQIAVALHRRYCPRHVSMRTCIKKKVNAAISVIMLKTFGDKFEQLVEEEEKKNRTFGFIFNIN